MNDAALYYRNPYESRFTARLLSAVETDGRWHIELDRTLFYPEGGGQPADKGTLNGIPVRDVRKMEHRILHITDQPPQGEDITGELDWNTRYHFMVQHTGQHLISAALHSLLEANTLSVHLGQQDSTIEVDRPALSSEELERVEDLVNRWIREDVEVTPLVVSDRASLDAYALRRPTSLEKDIRLVRIGEIDDAACGGIHVRRTGELGLIKYGGAEKIRGRLRLSWKIGEPAYRDYKLRYAVTEKANTLFCAQTENLKERMDLVMQEKAEMTQKMKKMEALSAEAIVKRMTESITQFPPLITRHFPEGSPGLFKQIVKKLSQEEGISFLLTMKQGSRLHWALFLPRDSRFRFEQFRETCLSLIDGKGGGKGPLWQGSGTAADQAEDFTKAFIQLEGI